MLNRNRCRGLCAVFFFAIGAIRAAQAPNPPAPIGKLIDVDGHRVHLYCTGEASPTVIVVSGGFSFDWGLVQPAISKSARICTYDTAGTAWSEKIEGQERPTCTDRVNELHALLKKAGVDGPYLLVGYSIGGLVARTYASRYPAEISGMVLVDHAFIDTKGDEAPANQGSLAKAGLDSPPVLISKVPIALDFEDDENFRKLPERDQQLHRWALTVSARPTPEMAAECFFEVSEAEGKVSFPLGKKPVAVISTPYASPRYTELQHTLLNLSQNNKQFMAENSSHMVLIDQPEIVVQAIQEAIAAVRCSGRLK